MIYILLYSVVNTHAPIILTEIKNNEKTVDN